MLIVPARQDRFPDTLVEKIAAATKAARLDFVARYQGELETFFTRRKIQEEIRENSAESPLVVTGLEPFYSKWPVEERFSFLRYMLRMEDTRGVALLLYCREDLTELGKINENNRGVIWAP